MKSFLSLLGVLVALECSSQANYQVKLMSWNLLNWPSVTNFASDTSARCPAYRAVMDYVMPDILITSENTGTNSTPIFLSQVMNTGSYHYAAGTFINGYDTDNSIFFRDSLFQFISNQPIHTSLRDISHFTVVYKATSDTLHIFSAHLKASQGYEANRAAEVANLRQVTNAFPPGTNFLLGGDFNFYNDSEPGYIGLLQNNISDDGNFLDVLNLTGTWNNSSYAPYHTQSTHYSSGGGFASGGMNDRFDMILFSNGIEQPGGAYYVPGTYMNIGNDGNHYNKQINYGTNTAAPPVVINGLFNASDHLPVTIDLRFGPTSGIAEQNEMNAEIEIFPQPVNESTVTRITLNHRSEISYSIVDVLGQTIFESQATTLEAGMHYLPVDWNVLTNPGIFFLSIKVDKYLIGKRVISLR